MKRLTAGASDTVERVRSGKSAPSSESVEGLRQVLKAAKLPKREEEAVAWFEEQGLTSIADLKEVTMENESLLEKLASIGLWLARRFHY